MGLLGFKYPEEDGRDERVSVCLCVCVCVCVGVGLLGYNHPEVDGIWDILPTKHFRRFDQQHDGLE